MAVPDRYVCPITQEVMRRPMMDREGHNFEQSAILDWLRRSSHCPLGREPLSEKELFFNRALKEEIDEWHQHPCPSAAPPSSSQPVFQAQDGMATLTPLPQKPPPTPTPKPPATPSPGPSSGAAVDPSCPWRKYKMPQEEYDHVMCTFVTFDTDGSGSLDRREVQRMCKWLNYPHTDRDIDEMFRQVDTDRSGTLDLHEFVTYMQERRPNPEAQYGMEARKYQEVLMQFHQADNDGDGELNYQELLRLCQDMRYPCSSEDVQHMFATMDADRNGRLSLHEFLTYMKTFDPRARRPTAPPMPQQASPPPWPPYNPSPPPQASPPPWPPYNPSPPAQPSSSAPWPPYNPPPPDSPPPPHHRPHHSHHSYSPHHRPHQRPNQSSECSVS